MEKSKLKLMTPPPEASKPPLTNREYYSIRELMGVVSSFGKCASDIEKRTKMIPGGLREMHMIQTMSEKLLHNLFLTIPMRKAQMILKELNSTRVEVIVNRPIITPGEREAFTYVSQDALERITVRLMEYECLLCDKHGKEVKKCQLRKDIDNTFMWDFPEDKDMCRFCGLNIGEALNEKANSGSSQAEAR